MSLRLTVILAALAACNEDDPTSSPSGDTGQGPDDTGPAGSPDDSGPDDTGPGDTGAEPRGDPAIAGTYVDQYGVEHEIGATEWTQQYPGYPADVYHLTRWSDDDRYVVALNGTENAFFADLWSRFDWTTGPDGHLYYCQTAYGAADEASALATPRGDDADPASTGCGGFAWTDLTP
jgi:hypothetical protein